MSSTLLNISGKIDAKAVALYQCVCEATTELAIPFVVVGASARDIVLHYGYGARIYRATGDIDFGIQVPHWSAFEALKQSLISKGFTETKTQHRMLSPSHVIIDIVPFGQVEDDNANISWPPDGDWVMNVLGFKEACDHAETVRIQDEPPVDIPVATPEGLTLLKWIAWMGRTSGERKKDAKDLIYLFTTYEKIPTIQDYLYNDQTLMNKYDWDMTLASAEQLGENVKKIASEQTVRSISALFNGQHKTLSIERLIEEMCENIEQQYERNETLTRAFITGFINEITFE